MSLLRRALRAIGCLTVIACAAALSPVIGPAILIAWLLVVTGVD